jgi:hypothetical protein
MRVVVGASHRIPSQVIDRPRSPAERALLHTPPNVPASSPAIWLINTSLVFCLLPFLLSSFLVFKVLNQLLPSCRLNSAPTQSSEVQTF